MDQPKTLTTVESTSAKEIKQDSISFENHEASDIKIHMSDNVTVDIRDQDSSKMKLKRRVKEEQLADEKLEKSKKQKNHSNYGTESTEDEKDIEREVMDLIAEPEECTYSLLVSNFPESWTFQQVCNFVSQSLEGVSVEMEPINENEMRLTFNSADHRVSAENLLQDKQVEQSKLKVIVEAGPMQEDNDNISTKELPSTIQNVCEVDPTGLYGLKPDYLKTLNITPPIGNWVQVTNFRCDKTELRDALELAGYVVACSVVNTKEKYAKVMYSHPLEAVQAVSMLNDQMFYGKKLNVRMDKKSEILLPKGLASVGPGLGEDGNFVREIAREYERFLQGKNTKINLSLFTAGNINGIIVSKKNNYDMVGSGTFQSEIQSDTPSEQNKPNVAPKPITKPPPLRPPVRLNFGPNMRPPAPPQMFRGAMPRGPILRPVGEMCPSVPYHPGFPPGPGSRMPMPFGPRPPPPLGPIHSVVPMTAPLPGTSPNWPNPQPVGLIPQMSKCLDSTTLKISNLPPTTSFMSLCGKLSTLAQVTSLEFTTPGCAVVKFASPSDAEKCFQNYRHIRLS